MAGSGEYNIGEAFIDGSTLTETSFNDQLQKSISIEFSDGPGDYPGSSDIKSVPRPAPTVGRK